MRQRKADRRTLFLRALRIRRAVRAYSAFAVALLVIVLPEFWIALYLAALKLSRLLASAAIISTSSTQLCAMVFRFILNIMLLVPIVRFWERADSGSMGLAKPSSDDVFAGIAVWLLFNSILPFRIAYGRLIAAIGRSNITPADLGFSSESWLLAFIASDVVFEELATRAYIIERISRFTGNEYLGAIGSMIVSVTLHVPGSGIRGALLVAPMLASFTGLYLWRRSAVPCALAHFLLDAQIYVLLFNVPSLGQWLYRPHYTVILLAGEMLLYCAVRWRRAARRAIRPLFTTAG